MLCYVDGVLYVERQNDFHSPRTKNLIMVQTRSKRKQQVPQAKPRKRKPRPDPQPVVDVPVVAAPQPVEAPRFIMPQRGDFVSAMIIGRIGDDTRIDGNPAFRVSNAVLSESCLKGSNVSKTLIEEQYSTTHATSEVKVSRTRLIDILDSLARTSVCKVTFHKKVRPEQAEVLLKDLPELRRKRERIELVHKILTGEERTLYGVVVRHDKEWGRSVMVDLNLFYENPEAGQKEAERQVDHRTLTSVTVEGVRYVCPLKF